MALTLASAARLLSEYGLLREIIQGDDWTLDAQAFNGFDKPFGSITYDTRQVVSNNAPMLAKAVSKRNISMASMIAVLPHTLRKTISPRRRKLRDSS